MNLYSKITMLLGVTSTHGIMRRYFVVNGFDGALTMLGLITGFLVSSPADLSIVINACLGAAIALGMSGVSSAYISEAAERRYELLKLQQAMVTDLQASAHAKAARFVPVLIALVNGLAPLLISLLILVPLWLARSGVSLPAPPLYMAISVSLVLVFLLGVFLARIASISWFRSGVQTLLVAIATAVLIFLVTG